MGFKERYLKAKSNLISSNDICQENRELFSEFFAYQERKLKKQNNLPSLDDSCYKTLYGYVLKFKNVNHWFNNKPWKDLTKEDIQQVYDKLEDGIIVTYQGKEYKANRGSKPVAD